MENRTSIGRRNLLALAGLAPFGLHAAAAAGTPTVVIGAEAAIPPLDPHRVNGTVGLRLIDAIFDPLVREDLSKPTKSAPPLIPALAESWSVSPDGRIYAFQIRNGVTFHDGTALDAAAVLANFGRLMDKQSPLYDARASGSMAFIVNWITRITAPSAHQVVIELTERFPGFPRLLSDRHMSIVSPAALTKYPGDALGQHPVGTGPFTLDRFAMGQPLTLGRNTTFWGAKIGIDRIIVRPILDPTSMAIGMQTGPDRHNSKRQCTADRATQGRCPGCGGISRSCQ